MKRIIIGCCIVLAAALLPTQPVAAHGGTEADVTSDYRTRITDVPDIDGLDARVVGLDGTIRLSWTGPGTLIVAGYEGEPYLRFDDTGVAVNTRSPAAYLNQDRYASSEVPASADPTVEPDWQPTAGGTTYEWHDHRTHWMSPTLPPQAQQDPNQRHVIIERWEVPLDIDGQDAAIAGDLTWAPAPSTWPWIALIALITLAASALLWSRAWRPAAAALAAIGTLALTIDTAGFVAATDDNLANTIWAFAYAFGALLATVRLIVHARRRTPRSDVGDDGRRARPRPDGRNRPLRRPHLGLLPIRTRHHRRTDRDDHLPRVRRRPHRPLCPILDPTRRLLG